MTKLRLIRLYNAGDVPDHVLQEVMDLTTQIAHDISESLIGHDGGVILSAFNRFHASMICAMVSESGLKEAARTEAIGLIKNVEHMSGQSVLEDKDQNGKE